MSSHHTIPNSPSIHRRFIHFLLFLFPSFHAHSLTHSFDYPLCPRRNPLNLSICFSQFINLKLKRRTQRNHFFELQRVKRHPNRPMASEYMILLPNISDAGPETSLIYPARKSVKKKGNSRYNNIKHKRHSHRLLHVICLKKKEENVIEVR